MQIVPSSNRKKLFQNTFENESTDKKETTQNGKRRANFTEEQSPLRESNGLFGHDDIDSDNEAEEPFYGLKKTRTARKSMMSLFQDLDDECEPLGKSELPAKETPARTEGSSALSISRSQRPRLGLSSVASPEKIPKKESPKGEERQKDSFQKTIISQLKQIGSFAAEMTAEAKQSELFCNRIQEDLLSVQRQLTDKDSAIARMKRLCTTAKKDLETQRGIMSDFISKVNENTLQLKAREADLAEEKRTAGSLEKRASEAEEEIQTARRESKNTEAVYKDKIASMEAESASLGLLLGAETEKKKETHTALLSVYKTHFVLVGKEVPENCGDMSCSALEKDIETKITEIDLVLKKSKTSLAEVLEKTERAHKTLLETEENLKRKDREIEDHRKEHVKLKETLEAQTNLLRKEQEDSMGLERKINELEMAIEKNTQKEKIAEKEYEDLHGQYKSTREKLHSTERTNKELGKRVEEMDSLEETAKRMQEEKSALETLHALAQTQAENKQKEDALLIEKTNRESDAVSALLKETLEELDTANKKLCEAETEHKKALLEEKKLGEEQLKAQTENLIRAMNEERISAQGDRKELEEHLEEYRRQISALHEEREKLQRPKREIVKPEKKKKIQPKRKAANRSSISGDIWDAFDST
ncbi:MAG: uncharacterized protein A8A55_0223 [Amphiamblys sp. WSBS2006]|nr:MAG: uncharacterized protein A8A55_0223 [Amphiamblys sp. WSBS2006]